MREVVLDTETTGLSVADGHRVVEIGCVELFNYVPTGRTFHRYVNPERRMPDGALAVHGLTDAFLADKPVFSAVADDFLAFIGDVPLVIHNADFDMGFINGELARLGRSAIPATRAIDTVRLARDRFFGASVSLDALCRRFGIDLTDRVTHGALKDAHLLADVYLQLRGGRQPALALVKNKRSAAQAGRRSRQGRVIAPTGEEGAAHAALVDKITNPIWRQDDANTGLSSRTGLVSEG